MYGWMQRSLWRCHMPRSDNYELSVSLSNIDIFKEKSYLTTQNRIWVNVIEVKIFEILNPQNEYWLEYDWGPFVTRWCSNVTYVTHYKCVILRVIQYPQIIETTNFSNFKKILQNFHHFWVQLPLISKCFKKWSLTIVHK